ncbi:alpha-N-acetylneuraminide alpha-2,8-sialyltransferase-like [Tachyglossus aculeatus]|uniref:alpha-N-acetylneuraminide alpha-2,8-sialyltransferase-like n=1 Tax=Tachyglossus aculeatus TaxID=9261 RepID=UPI0018F70E3B|nr:alpha-N-acetylneuraminide alpha-2,8-sialyltransferase-like [Tachyglossus aculeatus]
MKRSGALDPGSEGSPAAASSPRRQGALVPGAEGEPRRRQLSPPTPSGTPAPTPGPAPGTEGRRPRPAQALPPPPALSPSPPSPSSPTEPRPCWQLRKALSWDLLPDPLEEDWIQTLAEQLDACPWSDSPNRRRAYRQKLAECCDACSMLVVTQTNAPLGSTLTLDGQPSHHITVRSGLRRLFPEVSPFGPGAPRDCAVVGSGRMLQGSRCGQEIDRAAFVIRFKLPPLELTKDVGTKSHLVTLNPSILSQRFGNLPWRRAPFPSALRPLRGARLLVPGFSFLSGVAASLRVALALEAGGRPRGQALFLHPRSLARLAGHWAGRGLRPPRLSTGFVLAGAALELCRGAPPRLYGFWPLPFGPRSRAPSRHYYDGRLPPPGTRHMSREFALLLQLHSSGVLRLQMGPCA